MGRKHKTNAHRSPVRSRRVAGLLGTVHLAGGVATVETAEGVFRLTERGMREAMPGDTVTVSLHRGPGGERRAQVESVEERSQTVVVGAYHQAGPLGVVRPLDKRAKQDFFVPPRDRSPERLNVADGDLVAARIVSYPTRMESGVVTIERRIGGKDAPDAGIQTVMARYDLADGYAPAALTEAETLELDVESALQDPLRRDIRDRFLLTIDPVDARDFDDAISVERTPAGGWKLGVHIADVSHYVAWESSIDLEARMRSTSVYLADRVLPMLPERLSNDLCSLRPHEDRLAFTVDIELDARGRVVSSRAYPSAIQSRVRLDYDAADYLLRSEVGDTGDQDVDQACVERAERARRDAAACGVDVVAFLRDADELARARWAIRRRRGSIDFESTEVHVALDNEGVPLRIDVRRRTPATSLVEEAMLLANECVARKLVPAGASAAFRVHEDPSPDELTAAAEVLIEAQAIDRQEALGIMTGDSHAIEGVLERCAQTPQAPMVNALLLRSMQRAVYRPHNLGHYALGAEAYCHFTSPIRRYPDLLVHRALKMLLARERLGARVARERAPRLVGTGAQDMEHILPALCREASSRERIADAAARDSQKVKVAQYYAERIGERMAATVTWIDQMGAFVRVDETAAEGLVRMSALGGNEWWDFDERRLTLTGTSSGEVISLGRRAIVEVVGTDCMRGHLDFKLIHTLSI